MQNPYQPADGELELVEARKPRTTKAFRVTMWWLAAIGFGYIGFFAAFDQLIASDSSYLIENNKILYWIYSIFFRH